MNDLTQTITIKIGTACRNPFLVRWVNTLGGLDQFLFQISQVYNLDTEEMGRAGIYVEDVASVDGTAKVLGVNARPRVSVIAEGITTNEAQAMQDLRYSPHIHYWNTELEKWIRLIATPGSFISYDTKNLTQNFACEFELPELIVQTI